MIEIVNDNIRCNTMAKQQTESLLKQLSNKLLLLDAVSQSSPLAYFVVDNRDDNILYFNDQFCRLWGIENLSDKMNKGKLKNNDIIPFCVELIEDKHSFIETIKALQNENSKITIEDEIAFTDGRIIRRFSSQVRDEFDNYMGRLFIFEDITDRKRSGTKLKSYQEQLEEIVVKKTKELSITNAKLTKEISYRHDTWNKLQKYKLLSEKPKILYFFSEWMVKF